MYCGRSQIACLNQNLFKPIDDWNEQIPVYCPMMLFAERANQLASHERSETQIAFRPI